MPPRRLGATRRPTGHPFPNPQSSRLHNFPHNPSSKIALREIGPVYLATRLSRPPTDLTRTCAPAEALGDSEQLTPGSGGGQRNGAVRHRASGLPQRKGCGRSCAMTVGACACASSGDADASCAVPRRVSDQFPSSMTPAVVWTRYPDDPPSILFADAIGGRLGITHAWPVSPGYRAPNDICKPLSAEGYALHPEWRTGPGRVADGR